MARDTTVAKPVVGVSVVVATLTLNILALAIPLAILQIFDRVIPFGSHETLAFLFLGLMSVVVLESLLRIARVVLLGAKSEEYEIELASEYMKKTLNAEPYLYSKTTSAEHLERFAAIGQLRDFYAGQGRLASLELPFAVVFIAMIGLIGGWLIIVPILGVVVLAFFTNSLVKRQESIFEKRKSLDARRYSFLVEIFSQINTIKLNTMEEQMMRRFEMMQIQTADTSRRMILFSGLSQSFGAVYSQTALVAMGLFGGTLVIKGHIGIAELAACMLLNGRTIQPFVKMLGVWAQSEGIAASQRKLETALSLKQQPGEEPAVPGGNDVDVLIENLSVKYPDSEAHVLKDVSAEIRAGDRIAIIGDDGQGKSTLLRAIFGEIAPAQGRILIGSKPVSPNWPARGRSGIVFVGRLPSMFNGTILQNISTFGDGDRIDLALQLSKVLGLEDTVHKLPMGYNTILDEGGSSSMDRSSLKMICLVRALVVQPKVLLLQDPTYSLDWKARRRFVNYLAERRHQMTVVMATHEDHLIGAADDTISLTTENADAWHQDRLDDSVRSRTERVA